MNHTTPTQTTPPLKITPIPKKGITGFPCVILIILTVLSGVMLPLSVTVLLDDTILPPLLAEGISLLYLLLLAFYFGRTAKASFPRRAARDMTPLLITISAIIFLLLRSLIPAVSVFSLLFVVGESAVFYATANKRQALLTLLAPLLAFALSFALIQRVDVALLSCIPFPAAWVLAAGTRSSAGKETGLTRVGVICATSLTLGLTLLGFATWFVYQAVGTLDISVLKENLDIFREMLTKELLDYKVSYGDTVILSFTDKEEVVINAVNSFINTLPGMLVVVLNVVTTLAQMMTLSALHAYGFGASVTPRVKEFKISPVSGAVFLISWIVALVAVGENSSSTLVGTVAENAFLILIPGLALAAVTRIVTRLTKNNGRIGCGFFLIVLIPCLLAYLPMLLAFSEAVSLVFAPLFKKLFTKKAPSDPPDETTDREEAEKRKGRPLTDEELFDLYCRERERQNRKDDEDSHKD